MSGNSNAYSYWSEEVDQEEVDAARRPIWDSFRCASSYVQSMWERVAQAKGALDYHGTDIDLDPVIELMIFLQHSVLDHGIVVAGAAQEAVYEAWWEREPLYRQRRRSLASVLYGAFDPGVAHVS